MARRLATLSERRAQAEREEIARQAAEKAARHHRRSPPQTDEAVALTVATVLVVLVGVGATRW